MEILEKEVYFNEWCPTCEYYDVLETEEPCNECLYYMNNEYSHKPINWKEGKK